MGGRGTSCHLSLYLWAYVTNNVIIYVRFKAFSMEAITIKFLWHMLSKLMFIVVYQDFSRGKFPHLHQGDTDTNTIATVGLK